MNILIWLYHVIGSLFCHQLPERTIFISGEALPVCARDTGIYTGIFISGVYFYIRGRFDCDKPPRLSTAAVLCLFMLPMVADGVSSYLGLRNTTNGIRLYTGLMFGTALPVLLLPAAHFKILGKNEKDIVVNTYELLLPLAAGIGFCLLLTQTNLLPWWLVSSIIVTGFLFILSRLVFTVVYRLTQGKGKNRIVLVLTGTFSILTVMYLISHYLLQPLKWMLLQGG